MPPTSFKLSASTLSSLFEPHTNPESFPLFPLEQWHRLQHRAQPRDRSFSTAASQPRGQPHEPFVRSHWYFGQGIPSEAEHLSLVKIKKCSRSPKPRRAIPRSRQYQRRPLPHPMSRTRHTHLPSLSFPPHLNTPNSTVLSPAGNSFLCPRTILCPLTTSHQGPWLQQGFLLSHDQKNKLFISLYKKPEMFGKTRAKLSPRKPCAWNLAFWINLRILLDYL